MEEWCFGDNQKDADYLFDLAIAGVKPATSYLFFPNKPPVYSCSILTDWQGKRKVKLNTTKITILPFCKVSKDHAFKEGEGDKSLEYWQKVHSSFFKKECKKHDQKFSDDTLIVCEEFEIVQKFCQKH